MCGLVCNTLSGLLCTSNKSSPNHPQPYKYINSSFTLLILGVVKAMGNYLLGPVSVLCEIHDIVLVKSSYNYVMDGKISMIAPAI